MSKKGPKSRAAAPTRMLVHNAVRSVAWSPDGAHFALGCRTAPTYVCDAMSGETLAELHAEGRCVAWSPDGARLASASARGAIVFDAPAWKKSLTLKGHKSAVEAVAWSPNGATLATVGENLRTWDAKTGAERSRHALPSGAQHVAWSPDGRWIAATARSSLVLYDAQTGGEDVVELPAHPAGVAFTADGLRCVLPLLGPEVYVHELGPKTALSPGPAPSFAVATGATHARVALPRGAPDAGFFVDVHDGDLLGPAVRCETGLLRPLSVSFSPDGSRIIAGCDAGVAQVFETGDGRPLVGPWVRDLEAFRASLAALSSGLAWAGPGAWSYAGDSLDDASLARFALLVLTRGLQISRAPLAELHADAPARVRALLRAEDSMLRAMALSTLGAEAAEPPDLLGCAEEMLADGSDSARDAATYVFFAHCPAGARARAWAEKLLADRYDSIRIRAVQALGRYDDAVALVWDRAHDPEFYVRKKAFDVTLAWGDAALPEARRRAQSDREIDRALAQAVLAQANTKP